MTAATVAAVLPNGLFLLRLQDGSERVAHVAGDLRMALPRLLPGCIVRIEVSPLDPTKARIVARHPVRGRPARTLPKPPDDHPDHPQSKP
jgi:translation initiation factor IF-1